MVKVLFILGTRPEAVKLVPLIKTMEKSQDIFDIRICFTSQHETMLNQVISFFNIKADYNLKLMRNEQTLFDITAYGLLKLEKIVDDCRPDLILVQGDTTTAFIGSLAGYYMKIKVAHLEAGLRSKNKFSPFPEEINRVLIGRLADFHFAPTMGAKKNLIQEGIIDDIYIVGNTVIDALILGLDLIHHDNDEKYISEFVKIDFSKRIVLVTGHRRESFGKPLEQMCLALKEIAEINPDIEIIYPVHLNPNVQVVVRELLVGINNIHLLEPISYDKFIWLMEKSYLILTDSGGVQEEAAFLGIPVLVMREITERFEGIEVGVAKQVGCIRRNIVESSLQLLLDEMEYKKMACPTEVYGDGKAAERIINILIKKYCDRR